VTAPHASLVSREGRWRRAAALWAIVLAGVLVLLGAAVARRSLALSDDLLLTAAQELRAPAMDSVMSAFSFLGSSEISFLLLLGVVLLWRPGRVPWWQRLLPVAVLVVLVLVELALKATLAQPGPEPYRRRGLEVGLGLATAYAFPSGHALRAMFVLGLIGLRLVAWRRSVVALFACVLVAWVVGFSRVYLGDHWPSDVAGGILLAGVGLGLALAYAPRAVLGGDPAASGEAARGAG
jgi:undecaprenyl-diphosphatase